MNRKLQGGCQVPIGAYAEMEDDHIWLRGFSRCADGQHIIRGDVSGPKAQAEELANYWPNAVSPRCRRHIACSGLNA